MPPGAQIGGLRLRSNGVYTSVRNVPAEAIAAPAEAIAAPQVRSGRRRMAVSRTVIMLGLVSLFTDLSQEMVTAVLPLYLTYQVRLSPLQFGFVDGMYQGATALVRLLGGLLADRKERHKEVAAVGYGASAICKLGLVIVSGAWLGTTAVLMIDRLGKGIRTAPRDAMISLSSDRAGLGRSFGVHRALDTVGAMLGPLAAFVLLAQLPGAYDSIFLISFSIALIGLVDPARLRRQRPRQARPGRGRGRRAQAAHHAADGARAVPDHALSRDRAGRLRGSDC